MESLKDMRVRLVMAENEALREKEPQSEAAEKTREAVRYAIINLVNNEPTKSEFARKVGTTPSNVNHWMLGNSTPTVDKLAEIADVYGLPIGALMGSDANGEPLSLMPDEVEVLHAYRALSAKLKKAVGEILKELADA